MLATSSLVNPGGLLTEQIRGVALSELNKKASPFVNHIANSLSLPGLSVFVLPYSIKVDN